MTDWIATNIHHLRCLTKKLGSDVAQLQSSIQHWRARRVRRLLNATPRQQASRFDDKHVVEYFRFCVEATHASDYQLHRDKWLRKNPALVYAHEIKTSPENAEIQLLVEARVLAQFEQDIIATKSKTMPEVIDWYEKLFFDVRQFLGCRDWIAHKVLAPSIHDAPLPERHLLTQPLRKVRSGAFIVRPQLDLSLKLFSYTLGPAACELLINGFHADEPVTDPDMLPGILDKAIQQMLQVKSLQSISGIEVNSFNVESIINGYTKILETKAKAGISEQSTSIGNIIEGLFNDINDAEIEQRELKKKKGTKSIDPLRRKLRDSHVELTDKELIQALDTQTIPTGPEFDGFNYGNNQ